MSNLKKKLIDVIRMSTRMSSTISNLKKIPKLFPSHFVAYLEKHKIYELFYELATELLIERPDDPIIFIQENVHRVGRNRDLRRIVLLSFADFDKSGLAKLLEQELGVRPVMSKDLRNDECLSPDACGCDEDDENLTKDLKEFLHTDTIQNSGWILVDLPRTKEEAEDFQRAGILPTHVIQIILNDAEKKEYSTEQKKLREVYRNVLFEVKVGNRNLSELSKDCAKLLKTKTNYYAQKAPSLFRIVLIGPRGSGSRKIAKEISLKFDIVHVDFDYILKQTRMQENTLGNIIRSFERKWGRGPDTDIKIKIIENRVLDYECLKKGWILTGYPSTVEDFKLLDMTATPPNRVIFIEVDPKICTERITRRRYNVFTGSANDSNEYKLAIHPRDERNVVEEDIGRYTNNIENMMEYAGSSASIIDGNCDEEFGVREKIESCLMNPAPIGKPRIPKPPVLKDPMDIEFDPEDDDNIYE